MPNLYQRLAAAIRLTPASDQERLRAIETHIRALYDEAQEQRKQLVLFASDEAKRAAEHAAMVDQLTRLYKRVSARIMRENVEPKQANGHSEESVMDFRRRLGR